MANQDIITMSVEVGPLLMKQKLDSMTVWWPHMQRDKTWEIRFPGGFEFNFVTPAELVQTIADLVGVNITLGAKEESNATLS